MKQDESNLDHLLLTQLVAFPELGNALLSAERMLEECRYAEVVELLRPLSQDKQWHENQVYFLVLYYMGQALFRKEMARKRPREKGLDKASSLFTKALEYNPEFIDAHLLLGMLYIARAKFSSSPQNLLNFAEDHFQIVMHRGNASQKEYAQRRLEFLIRQ
jgi:tetratricopeptide (TPR) repeat protein